MKLVVSLTVHERVEVVLDTLRNFARFLPEATVIVHENREWSTRRLRVLTESLAPIAREPNAVVNSERLATGWGNILHAHLSNFRFAERTLGAFDTFTLHASNDLLVRPGAAAYMARTEAGFRCPPVGPEWDMGIATRRDPQYIRLSEVTGPFVLRSGQHEGSFYPRALFAQMTEAAEDAYSPGGSTVPPLIAREELWLSTLARHFLGRVPDGLPYVYSEAHMGHTPVDHPTIEAIRSGFLDLPRTTEREEDGQTIVYPVRDPENYYGVKRIVRLMDDPLRTYIRSLT